jgi:hypothetical protein
MLQRQVASTTSGTVSPRRPPFELELPNKGMKLTGALPRSARRHGRRPQLIPGVRRLLARDLTAHSGGV